MDSSVEPRFTLRGFKPEDLDQVVYINQACLPENYSDGFFLDLHERFPETFIVAESNGAVVGYIMCRIESGFPSLGFRPFNAGRKGHIISIAVLPEHRKKGVGRALVNEALRAMSNRYGAKSCYLEVRASNRSAIDLYKKEGFHIERTVKGYYSDGEDAHIMSLSLELKD